MLCHVVAKFWAERCALDRQAGFGNGGVSDGMGRRTDGLSNALSMPSAATAGHGNQNLNRSRRLAARKPPRSRRNERQQGVTGVVNTMLRNLRAGLGLAVVLAAVGGVSGSAQAQISDQAVQWYIQFVWNNLGTQFSDRDGTVIKIDKAKKDEIIVPLETAREVIVGGWRGARARVCDMPAEFAQNFEATRLAVNAKGEWTSQQRHFMKELYQRVIQLNSGKTKVVVSEDGKVVKEEEVKSKAIKDCTDEERASLKKEIAALDKKAKEVASKSGDSAPAPAAAPPAAEAEDGKKQE